MMGAANGMGAVLGPVLAGVLAFFGALVPMYVAAGIGFAGTALAWFLLKEPVRHADPANRVTIKFTDRRLRPFLIMWFGFFVAFMALQVIVSFYIQDKYGIDDPEVLVRRVSLMLITMAGVLTVVQMGVLQVFRISPKTLLRLLGPFFVLAFVIIGLAPNLWVLAVGFGALGISFACANPGINGSASLCVEPWEQGATAGFLSAGNTLGAILGPIIGTQIYTHLGHHGPMIVGAIALTGLSIYAFTIKVPDPAAAPRPARHPAET